MTTSYGLTSRDGERMTVVNPIALAEAVRDLAECWWVLNGELARTSSKASRGATDPAVPLDLDVVEARRKIDLLAFQYAKMLMDDTDWRPSGQETPALLAGVASRIGHFTHGDDPRIGDDLAAEVDALARECWRVARPDGWAMSDIDRACPVDGCAGRMRMPIDRDAWSEPLAIEFLERVAKCSHDNEHSVPAKVLVEIGDDEWQTSA